MVFTPHPQLHAAFETLAYAGAYLVYKRLRARSGDPLTDERRWMVLAGAAIGALVGSRLLGLLEQAPQAGLHWRSWLQPGGKTIVGGLLGGWIAVELVKKLAGVRSRTGDLFAIPLCLGIAIGRIGCFLAGLADDTYGTPSNLPWAVDFGDDIPRHPTQLYEVLFLVLLAGFLHWRSRRPHPQGLLFRIFLGTYLGWRVGVDFIKPQPHVGGLDLIQWAALCGLFVVLVDALRQIHQLREEPA